MQYEDEQEIARLRAAKADALRRGFAVLTCQVKDKPPYPRYSPHAANSATTDTAVAMQPYDDGIAANYGVNPGMTGLSVVDIDSGVDSVEALEAWMTKNNLPATFMVITGRDPFGAHLYYTGEQKTHPYKVDGVVGEVRSRGAFVVGFGSRHPSGRLYQIAKDIPMAALPAVFHEPVKTKPAHIKKDEEFPEIPAGQRDATIFSVGGKLRNAGLSEEAIAFGMDDYCRHHCEDGAAYADLNEEKIRDKAHRLFYKYDAAVQGEIVFLQPVTGLGMSRILAANALRDTKGEKL